MAQIKSSDCSPEFNSQHPHNCLQLQFQEISYTILAATGTRNTRNVQLVTHESKIPIHMNRNK